jgi:hypothetical protein
MNSSQSCCALQSARHTRRHPSGHIQLAAHGQGRRLAPLAQTASSCCLPGSLLAVRKPARSSPLATVRRSRVRRSGPAGWQPFLGRRDPAAAAAAAAAAVPVVHTRRRSVLHTAAESHNVGVGCGSATSWLRRWQRERARAAVRVSGNSCPRRTSVRPQDTRGGKLVDMSALSEAFKTRGTKTVHSAIDWFLRGFRCSTGVAIR